MVDTLRLLVAVVVTAAMTDDRRGCVVMLQRSYASEGKCLRKIGVDAGDHAQWLHDRERSLNRRTRLLSK